MESPVSAALLAWVSEASRAEAQAAAERLSAIGELFGLRLAEFGETADYAVDTWEAVAAEVAAVLRTSISMGSSYLRYAVAMRERLPQVATVFAAGDIGYRLFQTIVYRTDLITDEQALAAVDAQLAAGAPRWPSMTRGRLAAAVDRIVARVDPDAVRRAREYAQERFVDVGETDGGFSGVTGSVYTTDGLAFDRRLSELAATVCAADPRALAQRRADALGALAAGAERLACACATSDCPAAAKRAPASNVVIHVVAEQAALDGRSDAPGVLIGGGDLIPAEVLAELARTARHRPIIGPVDAPPEPGYVPSRALAEFVRCRDLTCRAPGCDRPAVDCDLDHTVPFGAGGPTHASNLKCLCRRHHRFSLL